MNQLLLNCDFLGYKPCLHINSDTKYRSYITLVLSIIVILLSILCMGYFGSELIIKSAPNVIITRESYDDYLPILITNKGFLFFLGIQYSNYSYYTDPTVFQINSFGQIRKNIFNETSREYNLDFEEFPVKIDLCSKFYKSKDIEENNRNLQLDSFYCAEPEKFNVTGFWGSKNPYSLLRIDFNKCENSTNNNFTCKPIEEIEKIIQNGYISMFFTSYDVDQLNYISPIKKTFFNDYNLINSEASLEYAIKIEPLNFQSDDGLMFNDINISQGLSHSTKMFTRIGKSRNIFTITFEGFSSGTTYKRNYIKLQSVLTQIGGFIKIIMLFASAISEIFSTNFYFVNF